MSNPGLNFFQEYWIDAWQRSILTLDVLRQRGNTYLEQKDRTAPHVLTFEFEVVRDGRTLPRPVNYVLVRIVPPADTSPIPPSHPSLSSIRGPDTVPASAA